MTPNRGRSIIIRKLARVAVCLLVGAVVTWAVAWGCALWGRIPPGKEERTFATGLEWPAPPPRHWPSGPDFEHAGRNGAVSKSSYVTTAEPFMRATEWSMEYFQFGWPFRSVGAVHMRRSAPSGTTEVWRTVVSTAALRSLIGPRLPARILPLGFALDTLFYGGAVLGLLELAGFARRRVRKHKGGCPSCGYDRRGLANDAACPECGAALQYAMVIDQWKHRRGQSALVAVLCAAAWSIVVVVWFRLPLSGQQAVPELLLTLLGYGVVFEWWYLHRARIRKDERVAKGICPSCGYDRRGLANDAACPECGCGA